MAIRARTPQFQGLARRNRDSASSGGGDLVSEGSKLHSLSIGNNLKNKPGTEFAPGIKHLEQISGGGISQPKMISTDVARRASAYAIKFEKETENSVEFYKKATAISGQQTKVHGAWAKFVEANMENGFEQYSTNSDLKMKEYEIKGKRLVKDWEVKEEEKGLNAVQQEFQLPVSNRMRQYA